MNVHNQPKYTHPLFGSLWHFVIPGIDPESSVHSSVVINGCLLDSGSMPGMTKCHRLFEAYKVIWQKAGIHIIKLKALLAIFLVVEHLLWQG